MSDEMTIRVDKGVPLPKRFPFDTMDVGDSFEVPEGVNRTTVSVAANRYGNKHGMRFTVRLTAERKFRCWRLS